MKPEQEQAYIQKAQEDPRAFVHLYDHYFSSIHAYVCYRVHSLQDAEDIIAEIFLKALHKVRDFRWNHSHSFAAWLFRIAHNLIVDYYRQGRTAEFSLELNGGLQEDGSLNGRALASPIPRPEEALTQQETFQQMRDLVTTLSPRRQEVITLKFFGGLRNKEIADVLNLDERTVASHLSRGLQDLRDKYVVQNSTQVLEEVKV